MKKGMTTIYDIAKALDISASTVSRALRNHPDISKAMADKIKLTAKKLNYRPNTIAQSLKERKTKVIGVLLPEIVSHRYMSILNGVEDIAFRKGYQVMVAKSGESYQREVMNIESLSGQVDGILACISQETRKYEHFKNVKTHNIPLVFFDRAADRVPSSKVMLNEESVVYALTEHLIKSGYQNIALLTGPDHLGFCRSQIKGYASAIVHHGIELNQSLINNHGLDFQQGRLAFHQTMKLKPGVDAIIAANDPVAMAVYLEAQKANIQLGIQLGLVSAGSDPTFGFLTPPVTNTHPKGFEIGGRAAQLCINEIEKQGGIFKFEKEMISTDLVIRQSSTRVNHGMVVSSYSKYLNQIDSQDPLVYIY
ncbi:LacI family DNA-binding transcriptional regulator [Dyadobacter sp. LHD-138]|uniref:LacI family DNA-binding transcriptional regulator n=1 Tax=Dyadobacter sp. LHD-138 TaxID=3071413 RepID=UPI0027DF842A|nr:LacI family DNA-binding transcriptional regulator [Dyadobacter sp. LHD-138]MDQ6481677.1 LacI family DNA-binding transcriptional regulator [Dyadobacter sp. LHD-138]